MNLEAIVDVVLKVEEYLANRQDTKNIESGLRNMIGHSFRLSNQLPDIPKKLKGDDLKPIQAYKDCILMMISDAHMIGTQAVAVANMLRNYAKTITNKVLWASQADCFCNQYDQAVKLCVQIVNDQRDEYKKYYFDWTNKGYHVGDKTSASIRRNILSRLCKDYDLKSYHFADFCSRCDFYDCKALYSNQRHSDLEWLREQEKIQRSGMECSQREAEELLARKACEQASARKAAEKVQQERQAKVLEWIDMFKKQRRVAQGLIREEEKEALENKGEEIFARKVAVGVSESISTDKVITSAEKRASAKTKESISSIDTGKLVEAVELQHGPENNRMAKPSKTSHIDEKDKRSIDTANAGCSIHQANNSVEPAYKVRIRNIKIDFIDKYIKYLEEVKEKIRNNQESDETEEQVSHAIGVRIKIEQVKKRNPIMFYMVQ